MKIKKREKEIRLKKGSGKIERGHRERHKEREKEGERKIHEKRERGLSH